MVIALLLLWSEHLENHGPMRSKSFGSLDAQIAAKNRDLGSFFLFFRHVFGV